MFTGMVGLSNGKFIKMDNPRDELYEDGGADREGHEMSEVEQM